MLEDLVIFLAQVEKRPPRCLVNDRPVPEPRHTNADGHLILFHALHSKGARSSPFPTVFAGVATPGVRYRTTSSFVSQAPQLY